MKLVIPLREIGSEDKNRVGGKAFALSQLLNAGLTVPEGVCISTEAYDKYVRSAGLLPRLMMDLHRKSFTEMRWEEMWDTALRIRTMFLNTPLPSELYTVLKEQLHKPFTGKAVVVRSSAPGEDAEQTSFAGLHSSYVNISGAEEIIRHVQMVWASLWSDAALLYRQELGLDVEKSSMAVVIQEIIAGDVSGIAFSEDPQDPSQAVIEAVYGLNQALVDGTLEPDRWIIDRKKGTVLSHHAAGQARALRPSPSGTELKPLPQAMAAQPPLDGDGVTDVLQVALRTENIFGAPQDVEWTSRGGTVHVLQSRPVTTRSAGTDQDRRSWYLSLKKSFHNLKTLHSRIEKDLIPALLRDAADLSQQDVTVLDDEHLAEEIHRRKEIFEKWSSVYWKDFIPFAHGMRLFGVAYNDAVHPEDPYEFMRLLGSGSMSSLRRNQLLQKMASRLKDNQALQQELTSGRCSDKEFERAFREFAEGYGDIICRTTTCEGELPDIARLLSEMALRDSERSPARGVEATSLEEKFLAAFHEKDKAYARDLLNLGRASYQLRDDDNIFLGKIKGQFLRARHEQDRRAGIPSSALENDSSLDLLDALKPPEVPRNPVQSSRNEKGGYALKARQIVGQPAGPGIATGPARVIQNPADLFNFRAGEVLVCDALDPNMTFVIPLAAAVVERRGGMLIHGAIIAREYGLPCVTGIPDATSAVRSGDQVTVDGYLGILIVA